MTFREQAIERLECICGRPVQRCRIRPSTPYGVRHSDGHHPRWCYRDDATTPEDSRCEADYGRTIRREK